MSSCFTLFATIQEPYRYSSYPHRTLNPGFCHNTELKFLPLAKGILHIEAVRVIDLVENKSVDIHDLPEIVAEERLQVAVDEQPVREG